MAGVDRILSRAVQGLLLAVLLLAPWFFGAWETWWFWPFAGAILAATGLFGLRLLLRAAAPPDADPDQAERRAALPLALAFVPLLVYAAFRATAAQVRFDAERSLLMLLTPWLLAVMLAFTTSPAGRRRLFHVLAVNLLLLGLYGVINHLVTGSHLVMWEPGYEHYTRDHRATGSYYCPDHYAGIVEIGAAVGLGLLLRTRAVGWRALGAALLLVGVVGVAMSKSRGGGLTLVVMAGATLVWGMAHLPRAVRPWLRLAVCCAFALGALIFVLAASAYTERFLHFFGGPALRDKAPREMLEVMRDHIIPDARPQMMFGAYRAWRTAPWLGIGPGMHENLWPHFAASPDGDRATGRWPTYPNTHYHANAVHNDWLQLLQEYGLVGFVLFLVPVAACGWRLHRRVTPAADLRRASPADRRAAEHDGAMVLGALLTAVAMGFHSLGDFNLQMPATAWLVAALVALPLAGGARAPAPDDGSAA